MKNRPLKFLAVIPARGGSKRLPLKNKLPIGGKPLIAWTIEAALRSKRLDEVMVSTNDKEIASVARQYGAKVPFIRPDSLSTDSASSYEVVSHALQHYRKHMAMEFEYAILLQPTSPLRDEGDIDRAIAFLRSKKADAVISVCEADHPPHWCNTLPEDLSLAHFLAVGQKGTQAEKQPRYHRLNGAIYICKTERLISEKTLFINDNIFAFIMEREHSVDIDTALDFKLASVLLKERSGRA